MDDNDLKIERSGAIRQALLNIAAFEKLYESTLKLELAYQSFSHFFKELYNIKNKNRSRAFSYSLMVKL